MTYFSHIDPDENVYKVNMIFLSFQVKLGDLPSYEIRSKERIVEIDFATYVLGAIGTWFGLSFININPSLLIDGYTKK